MSPVFDCTTDHGRADAIPKAAAGVREGRLVVLPTDTLYGIGADAFSPEAVRALLDAKGRGSDMPPPVLVPDARTVDGLATDVPDYARALVAAFWPGPLTIVLRAAALADVGPRRDRRHRRAADARRPGGARAAARGRPDGREQRQPHRSPGLAHRRRGGQPARGGRGVLPRRRPGRPAAWPRRSSTAPATSRSSCGSAPSPRPTSWMSSSGPGRRPRVGRAPSPTRPTSPTSPRARRA